MYKLGLTISHQVVRMNLRFVTKTYVMGGPFDFKGREPMEWMILKKKKPILQTYLYQKILQPTTAEKKTDARLISQKA